MAGMECASASFRSRWYSFHISCVVFLFLFRGGGRRGGVVNRRVCVGVVASNQHPIRGQTRDKQAHAAARTWICSGSSFFTRGTFMMSLSLRGAGYVNTPRRWCIAAAGGPDGARCCQPRGDGPSPTLLLLPPPCSVTRPLLAVLPAVAVVGSSSSSSRPSMPPPPLAPIAASPPPTLRAAAAPAAATGFESSISLP